jgi:hypothetical protein
LSTPTAFSEGAFTRIQEKISILSTQVARARD